MRFFLFTLLLLLQFQFSLPPVTAAPYGSVDLSLLYRLHPYNLFFYLDDLGTYILPTTLSKRKGGYDLDNLYLIQIKLRKKLSEKHQSQIREARKIFGDIADLEFNLQALAEQYKSAQAQMTDEAVISENDRNYLQAKKTIEVRINDLYEKQRKVMDELSRVYIAGKKEEDSMKKTIQEDIASAIEQIRKEASIGKLFFLPESDRREKKISAKADIRSLCAGRSKDLAEADQSLVDCLVGALNDYPDFCRARDTFILYGGADFTCEILGKIYDRYSVSLEIREIVLGMVRGGSN
ncbi:MAG: hypothetical protein PHW04_06430 [Candidatus Wallbacteria bacterium]|nr:hypothetical protein [Candidatus Wallbacteria bacterium]